MKKYTLNDDDLNKVSGGLDVEYVAYYSFDKGDTFFKEPCTYLVISESVTKVPLSKAVNVLKYYESPVTHEFKYQDPTICLCEYLINDYEYKGKDIIK